MLRCVRAVHLTPPVTVIARNNNRQWAFRHRCPRGAVHGDMATLVIHDVLVQVYSCDVYLLSSRPLGDAHGMRCQHANLAGVY